MTEAEATPDETAAAVEKLTANAELPEFDFSQFATPASDLNDWKSALIFGDPGAGKSWLAGSVSVSGKTLLLDTEGGAASVARSFPDVDVIPIDSYDKGEFMVHKLLTEKHGYKNVIIDTLGTQQARAEKVFRESPATVSPKTGKTDGYAVFGLLKDWLVAPTWVDNTGIQRGGLAWKLHEAPFRTIFVAHSKIDRDEMGSVSIVPNLLGGAKDVLPAIPDLVGYLTREEVDGNVERVLYVNSGGQITTKNRFGLPGKIYSPTFGKIDALIKGEEES